jgi:uncharacterized membrane protein required for colicin V production
VTRLIERVGMGAVIAAFVAIFCYQVAYGMSETVTNGNITTTFTATLVILWSVWEIHD